jgi:hypothetical protein
MNTMNEGLFEWSLNNCARVTVQVLQCVLRESADLDLVAEAQELFEARDGPELVQVCRELLPRAEAVRSSSSLSSISES